MKTIRTTLSIVALLTAFYSCSTKTDKQEKEEPVKVTIYSASEADKGGFHLSGQLTAKQTATISTRMMGYIRKIYVKPGDRVKAGQLLISISNEELLAKKAQVKSMMTEAEAAAANASRDYERYKRLREQNSVSDKELENVNLQNTSMQSKLQMARQSLREINAMLSYTDIQAPFAGIVTQKMVDEGSMANPGMPLLVVEQNGGLQVVTSIPENYISYVKVGDAANLMIHSIGETLQGKVSELSPSAYGTGGQYVAKLSIETKGQKDLQSGMFVNIFIPKDTNLKTSSKLLLDPSAIIYRDQLTGIYVVDDQNQASLRWIKLGKEIENKVEVLSGLNSEDRVILKAEGKLYNGKKVSIL